MLVYNSGEEWCFFSSTIVPYNLTAISLPRRINEEFASLLSLGFFAVLQKQKRTSSSTAGGVKNTSQLHEIIFPT